MAKTNPRLTRADQTPEGKKVWETVELAASLAPDPPELRAEPCVGLMFAEAGGAIRSEVHCPGCISATERIAELERQLESTHNNYEGSFVLLRENLTAMRTISRELVTRLREWRVEHITEAQMLRKGGECWCSQCELNVVAIGKARKLGVVDEATP